MQFVWSQGWIHNKGVLVFGQLSVRVSHFYSLAVFFFPDNAVHSHWITVFCFKGTSRRIKLSRTLVTFKIFIFFCLNLQLLPHRASHEPLWRAVRDFFSHLAGEEFFFYLQSPGTRSICGVCWTLQQVFSCSGITARWRGTAWTEWRLSCSKMDFTVFSFYTWR